MRNVLLVSMAGCSGTSSRAQHLQHGGIDTARQQSAASACRQPRRYHRPAMTVQQWGAPLPPCDGALTAEIVTMSFAVKPSIPTTMSVLGPTPEWGTAAVSHPGPTPTCPVSSQSDLLVFSKDDVLLQLDKMEQLVSRGSGPGDPDRSVSTQCQPHPPTVTRGVSKGAPGSLQQGLSARAYQAAPCSCPEPQLFLTCMHGRPCAEAASQRTPSLVLEHAHAGAMRRTHVCSLWVHLQDLHIHPPRAYMLTFL